MAQVLRRYPSAQVVIGDGAYDREGLLAWLLGCSDGLCEVEACWVEWSCVRWLVRRLAGEKKC